MNSGSSADPSGYIGESSMLNDDRWTGAALCARDPPATSVNISQAQYSLTQGKGVRLEVVEERGGEVIHFFEEATGTIIESRGSTFRIRTPELDATVALPLPLARRALSGSR